MLASLFTLMVCVLCLFTMSVAVFRGYLAYENNDYMRLAAWVTAFVAAAEHLSKMGS